MVRQIAPGPRLADDNDIDNDKNNTLRLHPWRDGYHATQKRIIDLGNKRNNIQSVIVLLQDFELEYVLSDYQLIDIFERIGTEFHLKLKSVTVLLDVSLAFPLPQVANPPIAALTMLLSCSSKLQCLTLKNLRLLGDDFDVNGLAESLRIHPTLHTLVMTKCWLVSDDHLIKFQQAIADREEQVHVHVHVQEHVQGGMRRMKHVDWRDNVIMDLPVSSRIDKDASNNHNKSSNNRPFWENSPMFSWCVYPIACCM